MNTGRKPTSWGWIIFWFIFFWPIGLILLIKRLAVDKSATLNNGKTVAVISYILIGIGVIYLIMAFTEESSLSIAAVLFIGGGIWVNRVAAKMKHRGDRYKKYIDLIVNQNQTAVDSIASAVGVTYDVAVADLRKMIAAGYFVGAQIDLARREIVLMRHAVQQVSQFSAAQPRDKVVTCGSCGANNKVPAGGIAECEYCGSLLQ